MVWTCPTCGRKNSDYSVKCPKCGSLQGQAANTQAIKPSTPFSKPVGLRVSNSLSNFANRFRRSPEEKLEKESSKAQEKAQKYLGTGSDAFEAQRRTIENIRKQQFEKEMQIEEQKLEILNSIKSGTTRTAEEIKGIEAAKVAAAKRKREYEEEASKARRAEAEADELQGKYSGRLAKTFGREHAGELAQSIIAENLIRRGVKKGSSISDKDLKFKGKSAEDLTDEIVAKQAERAETKKAAEEGSKSIPMLGSLMGAGRKPAPSALRRFAGGLGSKVGQLNPSREERGGSTVVCPKCMDLYEQGTLPAERKKKWEDIGRYPNFDYSISESKCPVCGTPNPEYRKPKSLKESAGKHVKGSFYEALMLVIAALFCYVVPPLIALPPLNWLAFGLFFAAAYVMLPGQHQVLESLGPGEDLGIKSGALMMKSFVKIFAFGSIIFQFWMLNRVIALIVGFLFYFTMPLRYKTTKPWEMIESWIRMGLGAFLAYIFWMTFGAGSAISNSLFCLGLAFFATLPNQIEASDEETAGGRYEFKIKIEALGKAKQTAEVLEKVIFMIFMLAGLFYFIMPYGGFNFADSNVVLFLAVWGLAAFTGTMSGPEARPAVGVLVILVSMFVFSTAYTGVVGQALFGVWWPQIYSFSQTYMAPLGDALGQAQDSLSETWLIMTNPMAYYAKIADKQKAQTSKVKTGGTSSSIEITRFEFDTQMLDPAYIPLLGTIDIENKGEFESNFVNSRLAAYWTNATKVGSVPGIEESKTGIFQTIYCSGNENIDVIPIGEGTNTTGCDWIQTIYPHETKSLSFKMSKGEDGPWWTVDFPPGDNIDLAQINDTDPTAPYYFSGGQNIILKANFTYNYNVNVSIPIQIINKDYYETMVRAREIMLNTVESQYTGGPAKATISTQKQPIRTDQESLITFYIYNEGEGNITGVNNVTIIVPKILSKISPIPIEASTFTSGCTDSNNLTLDNGNYMVKDCKYETGLRGSVYYPEISRGNYRKVSFFVKPDFITDQKTTSIIVLVSYNYTKTKTANLPIAMYPFA